MVLIAEYILNTATQIQNGRNEFKSLCNIIPFKYNWNDILVLKILSPSPKISKILEDIIHCLDLTTVLSKLRAGQEIFRKNKTEALQLQYW